MISVDEVIRVAHSKLNYVGGGDQQSPDTIFGEWAGVNPAQRCASFGSWVLADGGTQPSQSPIAGMNEIRKAGAAGITYCPTGAEWFHQQNTFQDDYRLMKAGDIGFQYFSGNHTPSHTWICVRDYDPATQTVGTIQGNTPDEAIGQSGNTVPAHDVRFDDRHNKGFGRPAYGAPGSINTTFVDPTTSVLTSSSGLGDAMTDSNGVDLVQIAAMPGVALIPITGKSGVSASNQLSTIMVRGSDMQSQISGQALSAQMSYSTTQVGQLSLVVLDTPDAATVRSGLFDLGTSIDFGDQHMEVRTLGITNQGGTPRLNVAARSRAIAALRGPLQSGPGTWGTQSVSQWVKDRCAEVGARPLVEELGLSFAISRQTSTTVETTWDVIVRLATTLGVWAFEYDQTIMFAHPTYLRNLPNKKGWGISWSSQFSYSKNMTGMPVWDGTFDGSGAETLAFNLIGDDAHTIRPGEYVSYDGPGPSGGDWMVTSVTINAVNGQPVTVSCDRIINPTPTSSA